ncbi:IgaA/UmoB family intracellular growth attenuator [Stenotrophomonas sp. LGBM10]|uniref:IgaA/UmoB family intracellular growth attenuator n=1 Tax=Stenotrophomonas sp. LGBM10 TaxID=3390038 RepID=UPI00398B0F28
MSVLFFVLLVAGAVLGPGRYLFLRASSRNALLHLRAQPDHRPLEPDERAALAPLLASVGHPAEGGVKRLDGVYRRSGFWYQGAASVHDLIDGVEVVLPFDAHAHLAAHNAAEVVICGKVAIVVRVNAFHLRDGYARSLQIQADMVREHALDPDAVPSGIPFPGPAQVLSERDETPEEIALRRRWRARWPCIVAGLSACLVWWIATFDIGRASAVGLVAGGLLLALAVVLFLRPAGKGATAARVVRVRGIFHLLVLPSPQNAAVADTHLLIGHDRRLQLPFAWNDRDRLVPGQWLDAEICLADGKTLSIGRHWSRVDEQQRFPATGLATHALMFAGAVLALAWALASGHGPLDDMQRAAWLFSGSEWRGDAVAATVQRRPPAPGDHLDVRAHGYCMLTGHEDAADGQPRSDCSRLRWDAMPVDAPPVNLPPAIGALEAGGQLRTEVDRDDHARRMALARQYQYDPVARVYGSMQVHRRVSVDGLPTLVDLVDRACAEGLPACEPVYQALLQLPWASRSAQRGSEAPTTWPDLVALTASGAVDTVPLLEERRIDQLRDLIKDRVDRYVQAQLQAMLPALREAGQPGVVLAHGMAPPDTPYAQESAHARWERTRAEISRPRTVAVAGQVVERVDDGRTLHLTLDPTLPSNLGMAGLIHTVWWMLAALLVGWHGVCVLRRTAPAVARSNALDRDIDTRPPPGCWEQ